MWHELKYATRSLTQAPSFSLLVIVTLGLGIGAATAFISVINWVLLSPLPYEDAGRLVMIFQRSPAVGVEQDSLSPPQVRDIREQSTASQSIAMMASSSRCYT